MVGLGDLPGGVFHGGAERVSGDGRIIVGLSASERGEEAFVWDAADGMRALAHVLTEEYGLDLTGWRLRSCFTTLL